MENATAAGSSQSKTDFPRNPKETKNKERKSSIFLNFLSCNFADRILQIKIQNNQIL